MRRLLPALVLLPACAPADGSCPEEPGAICTVVGTGEAGFNGDGLPAAETELFRPIGLAFEPSGAMVLLDWANHRIRRVDEDGTVRTIVGTDFPGDGSLAGDEHVPPGVPGDTVSLNHPTDLVVADDGAVLVAAWHNHKIRRWDPATGLVTALAGSDPGFLGDGGPAVDALLAYPQSVDQAPDGGIWFVDNDNLRLRRIDPDGTIDTVAGTGTFGWNGDGRPLLETEFSLPSGIGQGFEPGASLCVAPDGRVFLSDSMAHRIRVLDPATDRVQTVAGGGEGTESGYSGDGGPALDALLAFPHDLELGPDGALWFADAQNHAVRRVDLETGTIDTVVGGNGPGLSGDGADARAAQLDRPAGIAFDAAGDLYIADFDNHRIRRVVSPLGKD